MQAKLPAACARSLEAVPAADAGEASGCTRGGQPAVPRLTRASRRREGVRGIPRPAQEEALVRLRQAPVRGSEGRARLSVALHRRVHPPVPRPRAAQRIPSHPPPWLVRQRQPRRDDHASARTPGTGNACGRRGGRDRSGGGAATRAALSLLWRPHVRHRDLRGRLPATPPADGNGVRYLMSETATVRTRITKGFLCWSMSRYATARPNTGPAPHSAPRVFPKRTFNAAQSKLINQTSGHNNVISELRRLPHAHSRAIKSP